MFQSVVDITIYYNGFHGDLNETYFVGEVDEESKQLVKVTYECINQAISAGTLTDLDSSIIVSHQLLKKENEAKNCAKWYYVIFLEYRWNG